MFTFGQDEDGVDVVIMGLNSLGLYFRIRKEWLKNKTKTGVAKADEYLGCSKRQRVSFEKGEHKWRDRQRRYSGL